MKDFAMALAFVVVVALLAWSASQNEPTARPHGVPSDGTQPPDTRRFVFPSLPQSADGAQK